MITGDHIETAKFVARKCGIISEEELNQPQKVMTGQEFRDAVGTYDKIYDS